MQIHAHVIFDSSFYSYIYIYIYIYILHINTCILGITYFVERSIHLIEEHLLLIITGVQA